MRFRRLFERSALQTGLAATLSLSILTVAGCGDGKNTTDKASST